MKRKFLLSLICFLSVFLAACAADEENYDETTLSVSKKGRVSETIVESFDKDYYDINELKNEFVSSVADYNEAIGGEEIILKDIELKKSQVYVDIDFTGPSDYERFVGETLFVGTVSDAYDDGYTMDVMLKGVEKGDIIDKVKLMGMRDKSIIILSEHVKVKTFKDIEYVSANVDVLGSKLARITSESDGLAYLVLK
ncbi:MAG: hypothetical protein K6F73_07630 [Lachnospiraceae bacterium]|nr:hypothetical protein [Lachnospiraceae bacterium]